MLAGWRPVCLAGRGSWLVRESALFRDLESSGFFEGQEARLVRDLDCRNSKVRAGKDGEGGGEGEEGEGEGSGCFLENKDPTSERVGN